MSSHFWWYVARAGGLVAWALVVASCAWGLLHALRTFGRRPSPAWMLSTHRYLGALAIVFVGVHVGAILVDSYVQFSLTDVFVPLVSTWHPVAVAWGIVGMYVLVAIEVTSLLRARLSPRTWRGVHVLSYVLLALVTIHLLTAGTDAGDLLPTTSAVLIGVATVFGAAMLLTWRTAPKVRAATPGVSATTGPVTGR
ncbi:MAG TPA: ferric reductase-like transmembrane domain-containing protein [Acidimicrobiia bacterium]|jgi:DMSO/TMAO reductase YedYZ heme-binding membrane subunit|nr:ferric reductase-like transmembrane domain-containing protein [Acidimicrobiia bacterium]